MGVAVAVDKGPMVPGHEAVVEIVGAEAPTGWLRPEVYVMVPL